MVSSSTKNPTQKLSNAYAWSVWVIASLLTLTTLLTSRKALFGTLDFSTLSEVDQLFAVLWIALLTNGCLMLIVAVIVFVILRKLSPYHLLLVVPIGLIELMLTIAATDYVQSLPKP